MRLAFFIVYVLSLLYLSYGIIRFALSKAKQLLDKSSSTIK